MGGVSAVVVVFASFLTRPEQVTELSLVFPTALCAPVLCP